MIADIGLRLGRSKLLIGLLLITTILAGDSLITELAYYQRDEIIQGQWWRLWTGHLTHSNYYHWLMNIAAVIGLYYFFVSYFDRLHWAVTLLLLMPLLSCCLLVFNSELYRYSGFSGIVQAWLSLLLIRSIRDAPIFTAAILAVQWGRIVYEQQPGYDINYMQDVIETSVAIDAHLFGAGLGVLFGLGLLLYDWRQREGEVVVGGGK